MVPIAVVALLLGVFLVWSLVSSDPTPGFSGVDILALMVAVVVSVVAFGSLFVAYRMGRSMSRRMGAVSDAANRMARKDMVDLLDALRTSEPDPRVIAPPSLDTDSADEIGDLARSFQGLHGSLIEVGARQMESLRAGVSNILVTLARRNSSLVDRQLAVLDELEAREDDPETLGGYYQVDHLAARMRRNAESLLVLAGSESPRVWAKAAEMSDVVRAAVSEVDEYQRVEVLALEPARLSGGAVTDIAHLLAELLENAVQFSPPTEAVRVTGLFGVDGYEISISDKGMGLSDSRVSELNRILERPPSLGLSVEPTMGIYVVAKLAHRHGLTVRLIRSVPGVTAKAAIPRDLLELVPAQSESTLTHRPEDVPEPVEVIDLTQPAMTEPAEDVPEPAPVAEPAPEALPVRVPGEAFADDDHSPSVVAGAGAATIKSALVAYHRGRRAADEQGEAGSQGEEER
jgi:signal transduction histidine kinase